MVNEDAPDLETLVEDSRNPHAVRQYIAIGDELSRLRAEIEALRADVVWAIRNAAEWFDDNVIVWQTEGSRLGEAKFDGTDADIVRAVREARTR